MKCIVKIKTMALVAVMCGFCTVSSDAMNTNNSAFNSSSGSLPEMMLDYKQIDLNEVRAKKQEIEQISTDNQSLIEELKGKRDELTEQEKSKRRDLENLQMKIICGQDSKAVLQFEKKRNALTKRISELETELQRHNRQINQIEGQLSELYHKTSKEKIEQVSKKIVSLEDAIRKEKENKCPGDMARYKEFQNNNYLGMSAAQIEAIKARVANMKTQYDQDLINLKQEKDDLTYSLTLIPIKERDLANAKSFQYSYQANLDETKQRLQMLIDQNTQAKAKHKDRLEQTKTLEKELPELQEKINVISKELVFKTEQFKTDTQNISVLERFANVVSNINIIKQNRGQGDAVLGAIENILNFYPDDNYQKKEYLAILNYLQGRDNREYSQDPNGIANKIMDRQRYAMVDWIARALGEIDPYLIKNDNISFEELISLYKTFKNLYKLGEKDECIPRSDEEKQYIREVVERFWGVGCITYLDNHRNTISKSISEQLNRINPVDKKGGRLSAVVIFMVGEEDEMQQLGFKVQKILNQTL